MTFLGNNYVSSGYYAESYINFNETHSNVSVNKLSVCFSVEAQREFHMNKVRASMSLHKHSSNSISTSSSSTYAMTIPTTTTSLVVTRTTSTTTRTTIPPSTTTTTTSKPTTRAVRTTRPTTPSTTTTKLSTRATSPATSSTQSTTRTTEPNTQIFRKHSSNNGLSNVISRGRDKSAMHATQAPLNAFLTPVAEDKRRVTTLSTTTKHYNYFANLRTRARPTISPQGELFIRWKNKFI